MPSDVTARHLGFGSLLFVASIICFLSWFVHSYAPVLRHKKLTTMCRRPLGDPDPATANLALAVVLLIVIVIQAVFNAWQGTRERILLSMTSLILFPDFTTSRTMNSIAAMLPLDVLVIRDGHTLK